MPLTYTEIGLLYGAWRAMTHRCHNPRNEAFKNYGARGISVHLRWRESFDDFVTDLLAEIGPRPSPEYSLDRKENNGNYGPGNCKWATRQEQSDNRRDTILIQGRLLSYWVKETGLSKHTLDMRLRAGWSAERALDPALQKSGPRPQRIVRGKSLRTWSKETGIPEGTLYSRLARGWSDERTLTT